MIRGTVLALTLGALGVLTAPPASAKGCLKGAVVGGVAGHYAGRHGILGAAGGCLVGRHLAKKRHVQPVPRQNGNAPIPQNQ